MANSDPDSESGQYNGQRHEEPSPSHQLDNGSLSQQHEAFGGARPKTRTAATVTPRSAGVRTRQQRCREWEESQNRQTTAKSPKSSNRRRRRVHRTNSSDSVFMIPGSLDKYKHANSTGERNSYEDWTENHNIMDNSDSDLNFYGRVTDRVPPLHDNGIPLDGKSVTTCASNSTLSLSDYRTEDPSDLDNLDVLEDDCYIYTYRGGTAYLSADLPNSFFRLDSGSDGESIPGVSGAGQSNLSTGVAALLQDQLLSGHNRPSSPDEPDFLELDFDPGSDKSDLSSEDSGQGRDDEDIAQNSTSELLSPDTPPPAFLSERVTFPPPVAPQLPHDSLILSPRRSDSRQHSESSFHDGAMSISPELNLQPILPVADISPRPLLVYEQNPLLVMQEDTVERVSTDGVERQNHEIRNPVSLQEARTDNQPSKTARSVPLVSPVTDSPVITMPRSKSLNNSISCQVSETTSSDENVLLCGNRLLLREALLFGRGTVDIHEAVSRLKVSDVNNSCDAPRAMIWSHKDACRKHIHQQGSSNHGSSLAAICNALTALNINISEHELMKSLKVRLKQDKGDLCQYLLSCSEAGFNHVDFISEIKHFCGERIVARFFPMHNRLVNLNEWLADWISRGCVPVATLNMQKGDTISGLSTADAWVNRMVWGVSGRDIFLTNPLEVLPDSSVIPQLDSPSELLIRREEIIQRFSSSTDLRHILSERRGFSKRWQDLNVLGQIVNLLRENTVVTNDDQAEPTVTDHAALTSHVRIPALFVSGITIFCDSLEAETAALLQATAQLPLKLHVQH